MSPGRAPWKHACASASSLTFSQAGAGRTETRPERGYTCAWQVSSPGVGIDSAAALPKKASMIAIAQNVARMYTVNTDGFRLGRGECGTIARHGITPKECEEAYRNAPLVIERQRRRHERRRLCLGETNRGRLVTFVVMERRGKIPDYHSVPHARRAAAHKTRKNNGGQATNTGIQVGKGGGRVVGCTSRGHHGTFPAGQEGRQDQEATHSSRSHQTNHHPYARGRHRGSAGNCRATGRS